MHKHITEQQSKHKYVMTYGKQLWNSHKHIHIHIHTCHIRKKKNKKCLFEKVNLANHSRIYFEKALTELFSSLTSPESVVFVIIEKNV